MARYACSKDGQTRTYLQLFVEKEHQQLQKISSTKPDLKIACLPMQSVLETSNEKIAACWAIIRRRTRCAKLNVNYYERGRGLVGLRSPLLIISLTFTHPNKQVTNGCARLFTFTHSNKQVTNGCARLFTEPFWLKQNAHPHPWGFIAHSWPCNRSPRLCNNPISWRSSISA